MHSRSFILAALLAALLFAAAPLCAQDITSTEAPPPIPFDEWIAETKRVDLPWSIKVSSPRLSILQRIVVEFRVQVPSKTLYLLGPSYQLFFDVRLKPAGGAWLKDEAVTGTRLHERMPRENYIEFSVQALIVPGEYTVGFILFDRISGQRSVALRTLKVRPLSNDPLPEISRDLPPVEFFRRGVDEDIEALPGLRTRLRIPVATRRPIHIELLVNFSIPEPVPGMPSTSYLNANNLRLLHEQNVARMLGILKVLSQMELANGSLHITALDLFRRNVFFEQDAAGELDWPRLRAALKQVDPLSIPVQALEGRRQTAAFFRDLLQRRLPPPAPAPAGKGADSQVAAGEAFRVIIVVSGPVDFERGSDISPAVRPAGADFRAYYLQYHLGAGNQWDDLPRVLRELAPRRFNLKTPEEFRRALARILADLRAL